MQQFSIIHMKHCMIPIKHFLPRYVLGTVLCRTYAQRNYIVIRTHHKARLIGDFSFSSFPGDSPMDSATFRKFIENNDPHIFIRWSTREDIVLILPPSSNTHANTQYMSCCQNFDQCSTDFEIITFTEPAPSNTLHDYSSLNWHRINAVLLQVQLDT